MEKLESEEQTRKSESESEEIEKSLEKLYAYTRVYIIDPQFLQGFIEAVEQDFSLKIESFKISYSNRYIREDETLTDILGKPVFTSYSELDPYILLFLDPFPGGNWSHPCLIATWRPGMQEIEGVKINDFPPSQRDFRMVFSSYLAIDQLLPPAS